MAIVILRDGSDGEGRNCTLKCDQCGSIYKKTYLKAIKAKHHFCNIECRREWEKKLEHKPAWKGGIVNMLGYVFIKVKGHPYANREGYVKRSRLVMEKAIGRYLKPEEVIHHINEIRDDDRIENLKLFTNNGKHQKLHMKLKKQKKLAKQLSLVR